MSRSLRIGIALGDCFIDERLFRTRESISIGQSGKSTFAIPIEELPRSWQLFSVEGGRYVLRFTDAMDGRLSDGQNVYSFEALKGRGAERRGDHWAVPLVETARGKVELGQMKLLFQFVSAPPVQPLPRLPATVRGRLADRIDPLLAIVMAVSIVLHFAVALFALQHDRTLDGVQDQLLRVLHQDTFTDRIVEVTATGATTTTDGTGTATASEPSGGPRNRRAEDSPPGDTFEPPDVDGAIARSPVIAAITGAAGARGRYSPMSEIDGGADLDAAIKDARGKEIASIGEPGRRPRDGASDRLGGGTGGEVGEVGRGGDGVRPKLEERVSRTTFTEVDDLTGTTLDPADVAKIIRARYLKGIKRCHERLLKHEPGARGRVELRFTVGPTGGVTRSSVKGFDPTVDACIHDLTRSWRFGAPKDDGKPTTAEFQIPLILEPGN